MAGGKQKDRRAKRSDKAKETQDTPPVDTDVPASQAEGRKTTELLAPAAVSVPVGTSDAVFAQNCAALRAYFATVDRAEWWWLMDQSSDVIGAQLQFKGYVVLDGFLADGQASRLRKEVKDCHEGGHLSLGGLVNGKLEATEAKYADTTTRGDLIGWFDSDAEGSSEAEGWPHGPELDAYLLKLGTVVQELSKHCPELKKVTSRSKAMVACYPGGGARYIKHVDNDGKHPLCRKRILTALIYLNPGWKPGDGGELAVYSKEDPDTERCIVEPLFNRAVLFWSDHRTPHEVRPTQKLRYTVSLWLLGDPDGCAEAQVIERPRPPLEPVTIAQDGEPLQVPPTGPEAKPELQLAKPELQLVEAGNARAKDIAPTSPIDTAQENGNVSYAWFQHDPGESGAQAWELQVTLRGDTMSECPVLEISDSLVRVHAVSGHGSLVPLLCLPLPFSGEPGAEAIPKWSKKRRRLIVQFAPPRGPAPAPSLALPLADQLQTRGWGYIDGFLPGPEADALRSFVLSEHCAGHLRLGSNAHEGPVGQAMKNDKYVFLDCSTLPENAAQPLNACARRCNKIIVELMKAASIPGIKGVNISQGRPMLAFYPGNGAAYGRHFDATNGGKGDNGRVLTLLIYLNPFWKEQDGGCLRMLENLEDEGGTDILPLHGRLVAFLCKGRCPHEVLPSWADRAQVTFWYYDSDRLSERCRLSEDVAAGYAYEAS